MTLKVKIRRREKMFKLKFNHPKYDDKRLNESICGILENNKLLSLGTLTPEGKPYLNTVFFAFDEKLRLYFISDKQTNHSKHVMNNPSVSVSIFDSHQRFWKDDLKGLQLFGKCYMTKPLQLPKGTACFIKRFPRFKEVVSKPLDFSKKSVQVKLHTIEVTAIKLFDEEKFGEETFIELKL